MASQPTRGLDVGSIEFVHRRIVEERDQGVAVLIISSELDEIYALSDRIAVMYEGKITGFRDPDVPAEELGMLMAGASDADAAASRHGGGLGVAGDRDRPDGLGTARHRRPGCRATRRYPDAARRIRRHRTRRHCVRVDAGGRRPRRTTEVSPDERATAAPPPAPAETRREPSPAPSGRGQFGRAVIDGILEGNSVVVTILAIVVAMVLGGLLIAFTDPAVLQAWGSFFSDPGHAIALAWDAAASAYVAMFEGAIINPHTVTAVFHQASLATALHDGYISAVFIPLSETAVNATPLILTGLSVGLAFRAGLFNIGAAGQWIGGAIVATWLGFAVSLPPVIHVIVCILGAFAGGAVIGWIVGETEGPHRRTRSRRDDHAQLRHVLLPGLHPGHRAAAAAAQHQPDQPGDRDRLAAVARRRPQPAGQRRVPARPGRRGRCLVAAGAQHDRLRVPHRRAPTRARPGPRG